MGESIRYKRVLLKISGEALAGDDGYGLDSDRLNYIAGEIKSAHDAGAQTAVVVGGGNFIRGKVFSADGNIDRTVADHMGMLATIMNGLGLQSAIEHLGLQTRVQSAINVAEVAEPFIRRRAIRHLEKGRVVVFGAGTGNPYFTTDTAATLRALEIDADCMIKATQVDGVYDKDPHKNADAVRFDELTFEQAIDMRLGVMDQTAFTLCRENDMDLIVLSLNEKGSIARAVTGEGAGTLVSRASA